eukprot:732059-Amphidinium_carterae.1
MVLSSYVRARQSAQHRGMARLALKVLLSQTTSMVFDDECLQPEMKILCHEGVNDENCCKHIAAVLSGLLASQHSRTDVLIELLARACDERQCPACKAFALTLWKRLSTETELNAHEWNEGAASAASVLYGPSGKRRHSETFHVQGIVVKDATDDKLKRYWTSRHMQGVLEHLSRIVETPCVISSAVDGGRAGRPQRELLFHWLWIPCAEACALLPPLEPLKEPPTYTKLSRCSFEKLPFRISFHHPRPTPRRPARLHKIL